MNRTAFALVSLVVALFIGCPIPAHAATPAPASEASVKPGINDPYLSPKLNITNWVQRFESDNREIFAQRHRIAQAAQIRPGMVVADVGAGTGLFVPFFSEAVGPKGKLYAVDIVKTFLAHIEKRAKEAGLTNVQTVLCSEKSVNLPQASIDLVFMCDVYHHLEFPKQSLASIHLALKPGGEMLLIDYRRIPGKTSDGILKHVRAGQEQVEAEVEAAGFKKIPAEDFLKENYVVRFRKTDR